MTPKPLALAALMPLALSACAAGPAPDIATPVPALPDGYFTAADDAAQGDLAQLLPHSDPAFQALRDQALANGPTLAVAMARIEAARAGAARAGAELFPNIGVNASATRNRTNPQQVGANLPAGVSIDTERTTYAGNVTARWDADLFGALKANKRAALARLDAANASAQAVRLALVSEIATSVIAWRSLETREAALKEDLEAAKQLAILAGKREEAGLAPGFDRVRAEAAAASSQSRLTTLDSERAQLVGRLVTLTAMDAGNVTTALAQPVVSAGLPTPPASLPSDLLQNRPDVAQAAAELTASDAELAYAARQRFPKLTLSAAIGLLAFDTANLFDNDSLVGSLGAGLAGPLLDFGRIAAEIDGATANKRAAFAAYRGAVFGALGDAEAAYGLVDTADIQAKAAKVEAENLQHAARLADTRYRAGLADFLTVLEARRAADASGERAASAMAQARRARVLLWQALGGDYSVSPSKGAI